MRVTGLQGPGGEPLAVTGSAKEPNGEPVPVIEAALGAGARPDEWVLKVRGLAPGRATVRLAGGTAALPVQVMPYAARIVGPVVVAVTGRPAPAAWVRQWALERRGEGLAVEPGASIRWRAVTGLDRDLAPGESVAVTMRVRVTAPGCLPFDGSIPVEIRNRVPAARETAALLYSNTPERVTACETLFQSPLDLDAPARLLYHHVNGTGRPVAFRVELLNGGAEAAEVQVIEGSAGPNYDPVLTGHRAAVRYWQSWPGEVGRVLTVAPGSRRSVVAQRVVDGLTVSGLLGLRVLAGGSLRVRVAAEPETSPMLVERALEPEEEAGRSDRVYPSPRKELRARYRVGDPWTFIAVGQRPISGREGVPRLDGNYGVLYEIGLSVENPTDQARTVHVALSPDAGDARGVFWIEGQLVEVPALSPPMDAVLATFRLAPGEVREVPIRTLPVAGSAYPARIVVRAAPVKTAQRGGELGP